MYKITDETLKNAYRPFDVVTNDSGAVGFISEVSLNSSQPDPEWQVSYSVTWLVGADKNSWWRSSDLKSHCNLFVKFAKGSCHPFGDNERHVEKLMKDV